MKYEYLAFLNKTNKIAIMSSNIHGTSFSKTGTIGSPLFPVHTGCIGFGLERLAFAIIAQNGSDFQNGKASLKKDWNLWNSIYGS